MSGIDLEIELDKLGDLPLYPPRRRFYDLVPTFIMSRIRHRFGWPKGTPREAWAVKSLLLRVFFTTKKVESLIETVPKAFYSGHSTASEPDEPEGGWN